MLRDNWAKMISWNIIHNSTVPSATSKHSIWWGRTLWCVGQHDPSFSVAVPYSVQVRRVLTDHAEPEEAGLVRSKGGTDVPVQDVAGGVLFGQSLA